MFKEDIKVKNNVEIYLKNIEQKLDWLEILAGNVTARDLDILNNSIREVRNFIMDEFKMRTSMSISSGKRTMRLRQLSGSALTLSLKASSFLAAIPIPFAKIFSGSPCRACL